MKKHSITLIIAFMISSFVFAQNESDALRYSHMIPGGTARFSAMGGSFGALGGDFASLSINPAGIGVYRGSEITITPSLNYSRVETSYFNNFEDDMKYNFNLNNFGVVLTIPVSNPGEEGGWQFVNFGFGLNRHNNYNDRWIARGFNPGNSFMTSMLEEARREGSVDRLNDFTTGLAWDTWLLGMDDTEGFFVDMPNGNVMQHQETNASGAIREFVASMGANYNDRLYLGATVGLPSVRYEETNVFSEQDVENNNDIFNSLTYTNSLRTSGSGYNFKIGAILRVTDMLRLGGAFHTPTFFSLEDKYDASMHSNLTLEEYNDFSQSPEGRFDYEINTPLKAIGSIGLVFGQLGLINVDYEYVDYTKARLRSSEYLFSDENNLIRSSFAQQHNVRVGGEVRLDPVILRAGYAYYSSPYATDVNDGQRSLISAGFGIREGDFFLDFAYTYAFYSEDYYIYTLENGGPMANRDFTASAFRATFGFRF
jgi:hypothetical protein